MKQKLFACVAITLIAQSIFSSAFSQSYRVRIINMIPASQSNEISNDTEPNLAVNPANPNVIAASAFTVSANRVRSDGTLICDTFPCPRLVDPKNFRHEFMSDCRAPIYFSTDGGITWTLKDVLPSNSGLTHDITLTFSDTGYLYAAILKGCQFGRLDSSRFSNNLKGFMALRSSSVLNTVDSVESLVMLQPVYNWFGVKYDMPWVVAKTVSAPSTSSAHRSHGASDHVFIGVNLFSNARTQPAGFTGQSATVMVSNDGGASRVSFVPDTIETLPQRDKNPAGVRIAIHNSGKVYALFYRARGDSFRRVPVENCDVVLVRDDDLGRTRFRNLGTGSVIKNDVTLPLHFLDMTHGFLEGNRITGSDLAIAVDPNNPNHVFVAWCSEDAGKYTLHFRHNTTGGAGRWLSINERLDSIKHALNPAIAVTTDGKVGFLYQRLTTEGFWETHFVMGSIRTHGAGRFNSIHDWVLSRFHKDEFNSIASNRRWLSDYLDLQTVGETFYGVFAAINTPDPPDQNRNPNPVKSRFPAVRPIYQRDETKLLAVTPAAPVVNPSIDPFFFKVEPIRH